MCKALLPNSPTCHTLTSAAGACRLACPGGVVGSYLHVSPQPNLGRIGALVALHSPSHPLDESSRADAEALGKQLCMHIAAARPQYLDRGSVAAEVLERERDVLRQQSLKSGKPPAIVDKMVEGRLKKVCTDSALPMAVPGPALRWMTHCFSNKTAACLDTGPPSVPCRVCRAFYSAHQSRASSPFAQ